MKKLSLLLMLTGLAHQILAQQDEQQIETPRTEQSVQQETKSNAAVLEKYDTKKKRSLPERIFAGTAATAALTWTVLTLLESASDYLKNQKLEEKKIKSLTLTVVFCYIAFEATKKALTAAC